MKHSQPTHDKNSRRHHEAKSSPRPNREQDKEQKKREQEEDKYNLAQGYEDEFSEFEDDYENDYDEPDDEDTAATRERARPGSTRHRSTH